MKNKITPLQAVVATITSDADDYAREVVAHARRAGLRVEADLRNEKINYKVREHSLAKVPVLLVVGKKEAAERTVSVSKIENRSRRWVQGGEVAEDPRVRAVTMESGTGNADQTQIAAGTFPPVTLLGGSRLLQDEIVPNELQHKSANDYGYYTLSVSTVNPLMHTIM